MNLKTLEFIITPEQAGMRLDKVLSLLIPDSSRTWLQKLIKEELVQCDGKKTIIPRFPVASGMKLSVSVPEAEEELLPTPEPFSFHILYEDSAMLVIDKPAGVVVHPGAGVSEGTVVNALLSRYPAMADSFGITARPGIVHRLDKDTSGCLVIAKTPESLFLLGKAFASHEEVAKTYLAVVRGVPLRRTGEIITLIGRHPVNRQKMAVVERNGKNAITRYEVIGSGNFCGVPVALLAVRIATGRTHQIRVHLSHIGFPVAGDSLYGGNKGIFAKIPRQLLHAWKIALPHPVSRRKMHFESPVPADILNFLEKSGINPDF